MPQKLTVAAFDRLRKELEREKAIAREQVTFFQTLIDTVPAPLYYQDLEGRYLGCNLAFEQVFGLPRAELIGRTVREVASPEMVQDLTEADPELLSSTDLPFRIVEKSLTYADGKPHQVVLYQAVFHDSGGRPAGLVGTLADITQRKTAELALEEQREFSDNLLQNSAAPCFVIGTDHRIKIWNRACEELTGLPAADMLGTDRHWQAFYPRRRPCLSDIIIDGNLEETLDLYHTFANSLLIPEGLQSGCWFQKMGGKKRYLLFEAAPIKGRDGKVIAAIETLQDLTAHKYAEEALRRSEESYRSLIERSVDAILVVENGKITFGNHAAATMMGLAGSEELVGRPIIDQIDEPEREGFAAMIAKAVGGTHDLPCIETELLRGDRSRIDVEACFSQGFHGNNPAVQISMRDITERKENEQKVWRQANFDALTGIPNRLLFLDRLQQAIGRAEREKATGALLFIDLDRFKEVNDTLGHQAGDALLQEVARRLSGLLRQTDTVARMGGDEFTVIMPLVTDEVAVATVVRRILGTLAAPFPLPGGEERISGSIGIALFPRDGSTTLQLLENADAAMYRAKEAGRNTFCFHSTTTGSADNPPFSRGC